MTDFTELAEMQFARLASTEQRALLRRIFYTLEYDSEGAPGVENDSDVTQAISELFGAYGVTFTNPDFAPAQFRYNDHRDARGQQCPHALQPASPPDQWGAKIDPPWCPNGCLGSTIEGHAPDTGPEPEPAAGKALTMTLPTRQHADDTTDGTPTVLMKLDNREPTAVSEPEVAS